MQVENIDLSKCSFAAGNGYTGFRSYFSNYFSPDEYNSIYILKGGPGTGKSTAMQLFSGLCGVEIITSGDLSKIFGLNSYEGFWKTADEFRHNALIIDDLGCESDAKSFGNTLPMADFIRSRESLWRSSGICTCFTSNATNREDIIKKYGNSICSRLLGMCEFIHVKGPDHRISRASGK